MEEVLPSRAMEALRGLTVESVIETEQHTLSLAFTDGSTLTPTAMPFANGTLDASFVASTNAYQKHGYPAAKN